MEKTVIKHNDRLIAVCETAEIVDFQGEENLIKVTLSEGNLYYIGTPDRAEYTITTEDVPADYFDQEDEDGTFTYKYEEGVFIKVYDENQEDNTED